VPVRTARRRSGGTSVSVVAALVVTAIGAKEHILAGPAMLADASARAPWPTLDLAGEEVGQERREVNRQAWFPARPTGRHSSATSKASKPATDHGHTARSNLSAWLILPTTWG
jgi:uncharacterized membrane protein